MKETTKKKLLSALKFVLCILPFAIIGGYFVSIYQYEHMQDDLKEILLAQIGTYETYLIVATLQSTLYAAIAGFAGYFLASYAGLIKKFGFDKDTLKKTVPSIVVCGFLFVGDYFVFGRIIPEVAADYDKGISIPYLISSLTYGGVIEEVLLRWFFMTLIVAIIKVIFVRDKSLERLPEWTYIVANVIAAIVFSAGHIPASISFFGGLSPLILFRCFLLNGGFALLFGRYYRKYGIQYAMLGHFGIHLIDKVILMLII